MINPILTIVLRSRFHRPLSKSLMVLEVVGRKTGRLYRVPVGRHEVGEDLIVSVSGSWRRNLVDGAAVSVIVDGRARAGVIRVVKDPDDVARAFKLLCDRYGPKKASLIGLKVNLSRLPTVEELAPAVSRRWVARIRLAE